MQRRICKTITTLFPWIVTLHTSLQRHQKLPSDLPLACIKSLTLPDHPLLLLRVKEKKKQNTHTHTLSSSMSYKKKNSSEADTALCETIQLCTHEKQTHDAEMEKTITTYQRNFE